MDIGVIFPQTEIEADPAAVHDFVQAAEDLGYSHIFVADHVLGADPQFHAHPSLANYSHQSLVHESLTLMGYMAAVTQRVRLVTGILILPQRQTALVAKQAAEIDVLSGGRLTLGIGVGWNKVEFDALGEDFHNRGRRSEEQIAVLRALWTQDMVDFHGRWHNVTHAGLNPLPVQRPIPVWIGGGSSSDARMMDTVLRRIARIADGWCPNIGADDAGREIVDRLQKYAAEAGRNPAALELDGRLRTAEKQPEDWVDETKVWEEMGASHISIETRKSGFEGAARHIEAIRRFAEAVGV